MNLLKKLGMWCGIAGPILAKEVPGVWGIIAGSLLTGVGILSGYHSPTPAAQKAFGVEAK